MFIAISYTYLNYRHISTIIDLHMENARDGEQSIHEYPSDWDIWIDSVGKKNGRVFGLGYVGRIFISTSSQQ